MKKLILFLLLLPLFARAQMTDAQLKTDLDNNIRNNVTPGGITKTVLANVIQNDIYGKLSVKDASVASGTDTYTITASSIITSYAAYQKFAVAFTNANTGAATLNVNGLGAKAIKKNGTAALSSGDIAAGQIFWCVYDGTNFQLVGGGGSGGAGTVSTVSVVTANGVSGSVATATTTPAITLTLGAITPTTVNGVTVSGSSTPSIAVTGTTTISGTHAGTSSGTNTGDQTSVTGNAGTATALATGRTISVTGDMAYTSPSFDGTGNVTAAGTLASTAVTPGSYTSTNLTVDAKGRITSASNGSSTSTLTPTAVKTSNYTAAVGDMVPCDVTSAFAVTLPTAPTDKSEILIKIVAPALPSNTLTITAGGSDVFNVAGGSTSLSLTRKFQSIWLQYKSSSAIWYVKTSDDAISTWPGSTAITTLGTITTGVWNSITPINNAYVQGSTSTKTGSYTLTLADAGSTILMNLSSPGNLTIPLHASVALPLWQPIYVVQKGANPNYVTVVATGGVTVNSSSGTSQTQDVNGIICLWQVANDEWYSFDGGVAKPFSGTGAITANTAITGAFTYSRTHNSFLWTATKTATANNDYGSEDTGTLTARATASDVFSGKIFNHTLVSAAATQTLQELLVNPTFTDVNSATKYVARFQNAGTDLFSINHLGVLTVTATAPGTLNTITAGTATANNQYLETRTGSMTGRAGQSGDVLFGEVHTPTLTVGTAAQTLHAFYFNSTLSGSFGTNTTYFNVLNNGTSQFKIDGSSNATFLGSVTTTGGLVTNSITPRSNGSTYAIQMPSGVGVGGTWTLNGTSSFASYTNHSFAGTWAGTTAFVGMDYTYSFSGVTGTPSAIWLHFHPSNTSGITTKQAIIVDDGNFKSGFGTTTPNSTVTTTSLAGSIVAKTANYTLTDQDMFVNCTSNSFTITLPTAVGANGRIYFIKNIGSGTITLATTSSQTIDGSAPGSLSAGPTKIVVVSDGSNWITF